MTRGPTNDARQAGRIQIEKGCDIVALGRGACTSQGAETCCSAGNLVGQREVTHSCVDTAGAATTVISRSSPSQIVGEEAGCVTSYAMSSASKN